ncbi:MAG TPA: biotin/lipoyl-containing protein, partial [Actinomycetes bacterium]|nr:biotin/lipoyl-containing protein [Actinomycetes bacterium]
RLHGVRTNRELLVGVLRHPEFLAGRTDTAFLDRHPPAALAAGPGPQAERLHAAAAALAGQAARRAAAPVLRGLPSGWRNNPSQPQQAAFEGAHGRPLVAYRLHRDGLELEVDGQPLPGARLWRCTPDAVDLEVGGVRRRFEVHRVGEVAYVDGPLGASELRELPRFPEPERVELAGSLASPLPGIVRRVAARPGERVEAGALLVVVEAMKVEHPVAAPAAGRVREVMVAEGEEVAAGAPLVALEEDGDARG